MLGKAEHLRDTLKVELNKLGVAKFRVVRGGETSWELGIGSGQSTSVSYDT
jgi:hypothetical protein